MFDTKCILNKRNFWVLRNSPIKKINMSPSKQPNKFLGKTFRVHRMMNCIWHFYHRALVVWLVKLQIINRVLLFCGNNLEIMVSIKNVIHIAINLLSSYKNHLRTMLLTKKCIILKCIFYDNKVLMFFNKCLCLYPMSK